MKECIIEHYLYCSQFFPHVNSKNIDSGKDLCS